MVFAPPKQERLDYRSAAEPFLSQVLLIHGLILFAHISDGVILLLQEDNQFLGLGHLNF